jgi:hypothetical protein
MSPDQIFAGITDLDRGYQKGDYWQSSPSTMKEVNVRYFPDRHFEPVEDGGVRSYVMRVNHAHHQGWAVDLIAWPAPTLGKRFEWVKRFDKYATRFKRASLFSIRRLAPAFNGGSDPLFIHRTPHHLLRSERPDLELYIDRAYGAVILNGEAEARLDQVRTIIGEDEEHARELSKRLGRPVRYVRDDWHSEFIGADRDIDWWLKHKTVTVNP